MSTTIFNPKNWAAWYAREHRKIDPGIREIHYLPLHSPEREIRLIEVNDLIVEMRNDALEPLDFFVDTGTENEHVLFILDVTPKQWVRIQKGKIQLPDGWSLEKVDSWPKTK
ncbi:MAG: hypothetical protein O2955_00235 [Planctomycetota bacterium]|nr:hypothetical protein [Planctomycetota bacterium]MDA1210908.1 hypothetical protein [Planctomycetota bacterium]